MNSLVIPETLARITKENITLKMVEGHLQISQPGLALLFDIPTPRRQGIRHLEKLMGLMVQRSKTTLNIQSSNTKPHEDFPYLRILFRPQFQTQRRHLPISHPNALAMAALRCLLKKLSPIAENKHSLNPFFEILKTTSNEGEEFQQKMAIWVKAFNREPQFASRLSSKL